MRGRWFAIFAASALVLVSAPTATGAAAPQAGGSPPALGGTYGDWPQWGYGPGSTSSNRFEHVLDVGNVSSLTLLGTAKVGDYLARHVVVANGVAYLATYRTFGNGNVSAVSMGCLGLHEHCPPIWRAALPGSGSALAVVQDHVYEMSTIGGSDSTLLVYPVGCAIGGGICQPVWTIPDLGEFDGSMKVASSGLYLGTFDGTLIRLPLECPAPPCGPIWTVEALNSGVAVTAVADGRVYTRTDGFQDNVEVFDAISGELLWTASTQSAGGEAIVGPPGVFVASGTAVDAYDPESGDLIWHDPMLGAYDLAFDGSTLFVLRSREIVALDPRTGRLMWRGRVPGAGIMAVANGVVYVTSSEGILGFAASCPDDSCDPLGMVAVGRYGPRAMAISRGLLVTVGGDGSDEGARIVAFGLSPG